MFIALIFLVLVVEYTVERVMEHYGYKRLLDKLVRFRECASWAIRALCQGPSGSRAGFTNISFGEEAG